MGQARERLTLLTTRFRGDFKEQFWPSLQSPLCLLKWERIEVRGLSNVQLLQLIEVAELSSQ